MRRLREFIIICWVTVRLNIIAALAPPIRSIILPDTMWNGTLFQEYRCVYCSSLRVTDWKEGMPACDACLNGYGPDPGGHVYSLVYPDWVIMELGDTSTTGLMKRITAEIESIRSVAA